ncbi:uncharacterized protein LOC135439377 [Drosophila montana]|uniref:uncharacterized protein LOC135439377 n=1 Tax=Drosophila montana TaxID=40370 RepID=UPI00313D468D
MSRTKPHAMLVLLAAVAAVDTEVTYLFHQWKVSTAPPQTITWTPQAILQPQISARNKQTTIQTIPPTPENQEPSTTEYLPETTISPAKTVLTTETTKLIDLATLEPKENGGFPFAKPGKHKHGLRHVKAHDGFHNLKREPHWAHWNDKFKKTAKPGNIN